MQKGNFRLRCVNKTIFITLPKKPAIIKCDQHHTISLMSHLTKLVQLEKLLKNCMAKGTRNAIFILRMMTERASEMQKDLDVCFIDRVKAFDKVRHEPLIDMLLAFDIDGQEVELIKNLYWDQQAAVVYNGEMQERLQAVEMWFLRRMLRIPWMDRVTNEEVLGRAVTHRQLMSSIVTRQIRFLGHFKEQLEELALTGRDHVDGSV